MTKNDFCNSNKIFKNNYNTLEKIFDFFLNLMSSNNYIIKSGKNYIDLYFDLNNNSNKINNYNIKLSLEDESDEYIKIIIKRNK